jgi:hypothetical protein
MRLDYRATYKGTLPPAHDASDRAALDYIYTMFNIAPPADFRSYSVSMADIVKLDADRVYYCDTVGWRRLESNDITGGNF